jgi:hypothetical protein
VLAVPVEVIHGGYDEKMSDLAGWVIHEDDVVEFVETSNRLYKIYQEFIQSVNLNFQKVFLLVTGTTDEKSYSGSAGVQVKIC